MHQGKENEHRHKIIRKSEGAAPLYIIKREKRVVPRTFIGHCGSASFFLLCVWGGGAGVGSPVVSSSF